ncbi:MAG: ABC transporter ATP-binding protein [Halosimplex sp.]
MAQETSQRRVGVTDHADPVIEARDASVTFDMDRGESRVLDGVSLAVERGEILGVVGESGSGKSMFASALLDAVVDPGVLSGEVTYYPERGDTVDVLDLDDEGLRQYRWEEVSMVFQGAMSSFNPTKSIRGHFVETIHAHDLDEESSMELAEDLLSDLYLDPERVLDSYPHELSGGMQQRTLIALSLVLEPEVLVMDEPTAALDLLMQRSILQLLREIKEKYDLTIVFITHDLPLVAELADRLAVMYAFEFVEVGPTDEILDYAAHPYTRALLRVTPNIDAPTDEMKVIEGSAPDPVNVPDGCSYHPRCELATDECVADDPPYYDVDEAHTVRCHHWTQADEAIPFTHQDELTPLAQKQ